MTTLVWNTDPLLWNTIPIVWQDPLQFGLIGRKALLIKGGTPIGALRTTSVTMGSEPVDITSNDDDGWRRLLFADPSERQIEITGEAILKNDTGITDTLGINTEDTFEFAFVGVAKRLIGQYRITAFEVGAPYNDAITSTITLQSTEEQEHKP